MQMLCVSSINVVEEAWHTSQHGYSLLLGQGGGNGCIELTTTNHFLSWFWKASM